MNEVIELYTAESLNKVLEKLGVDVKCESELKLPDTEGLFLVISSNGYVYNIFTGEDEFTSEILGVDATKIFGVSDDCSKAIVGNDKGDLFLVRYNYEIYNMMHIYDILGVDSGYDIELTGLGNITLSNSKDILVKKRVDDRYAYVKVSESSI